MKAVLALLQIGLAGVLVVAAGTKIAAPQEFLSALRLSRLPASVARPLAVAVPVVELLVGFALVMARAEVLVAAFISSVALLSAFSIWVLSVRARGINVRCGCFGASRRPIGRNTVVRNGALVFAAAAGTVLAGFVETPMAAELAWSFMAASAAALGILLVVAFARVRSEMVLSMEAMQRRRAAAGGVRT